MLFRDDTDTHKKRRKNLQDENLVPFKEWNHLVRAESLLLGKPASATQLCDAVQQHNKR